MINKYDNAAQVQFINTYSPIPFQEMMAAGQMKQERFDKAGAAMDSTIAAMDEIVAIPFSDDERRAKEYSANLRSVRDKYTHRDISDPFVQREMANDLNKSVNKEDIKHIQQSHAGWLAYNKELADNESRGVPTPKWKVKDFTGYDSQKGVYTGTAPTYKNPAAELDQFFKPLEARDKGTTYDTINGKRTGYLKSSIGIDMNDIQGYVKDNMSSLITGPAMRDIIGEAKANGDTRKDEEIAYDYVMANSSNRIKSTPSYRQDLNPGGGSDQNPGSLEEPELTLKDGVLEGKGLSARKIDKEIAVLEETLRNNPNDKATENRLTAIKLRRSAAGNTVQEGEHVSPNKKIESNKLHQDELTAETIKSLIKTGMTKEDATSYLASNTVDFMSRSGTENAKGIISNIIPSIERIASKIGTVLNNTVSDGSMVDESGAAITRMLTPEEKKARMDRINKIGKGDLTPQQILREYQNATSSVESSTREQERIIAKAEDEAFNKMAPYQRTYTALNGMFEYDKTNDVFRGTYLDDKNIRKDYNSLTAKFLTDAVYNSKNYQKVFFDENGKELSQRKLDDLQKLLNKSKGFSVNKVYNEPTDQGGAEVSIRLNTVNTAGAVNPAGAEYRVKLPLDQSINHNNFVKELQSRGQVRTAFKFDNYQVIEAAVNRVGVYKGGEIPLPLISDGEKDMEDKIIFDADPRYGGRVIPILIYGDKNEKKKHAMSREPVDLNNVANTISNFLQSHTFSDIENEGKTI
jgi:hypothetical protein